MNCGKLAGVLCIPGYYLLWVFLCSKFPVIMVTRARTEDWSEWQGAIFVSMMGAAALMILGFIITGLAELWNWLWIEARRTKK